jgi:hypothetical protein
MAFLQLSKQLSEYLCNQNTLFVWGPGGQGVEPPVRVGGELAPEISGFKIRFGKVNLYFKK